MKRNLLFYIYPVMGSCWGWHFDQLRLYREMFNGQKVVVMAHGENTASSREVMERAAFLDPIFVEVKNDPVLGEVTPFHENLGRFESTNPGEILFYAHGKGVRHTYFLENVLAWTDCMYQLNLGSPKLIDKLMETHQAAGAFRKPGLHGGGVWHFSGSFFWLRHDALFGDRRWRGAYADRYGVEGFPGRTLPMENSFCLTPPIEHGNLYERRLPSESAPQWMADLKERFSVTSEDDMRPLAAEAKELMEIGNRHGTDKFSNHKFQSYYARHLGHLRPERFTLLEIGIYKGASLRTWEEYFPKARIIGLDINPEARAFASSRSEVHLGDQNDPAFLEDFAKRMGGFDVVIDDGSHFMAHQRTSLRALFPHVRAGGYYVMEDIQTSYWQNWGGGHVGMAGTGLALVKDVLDDLNVEFHRGKTVLPAPSAALHVYRNIAFVERG